MTSHTNTHVHTERHTRAHVHLQTFTQTLTYAEARRLGSSPGTPVSSLPLSVKDSAPRNKAKINAIYTLSDLIAELSLRTTWHTTCCT